MFLLLSQSLEHAQGLRLAHKKSLQLQMHAMNTKSGGLTGNSRNSETSQLLLANLLKVFMRMMVLSSKIKLKL